MADRDKSHLFPAFAVKVQAIEVYMQKYLDKHHPGWTVKMIEGFRTTARQVELYAQGRTTPGKIVTQKNGTTNKSNHQSALAADFGFFDPHGKYKDPPADVWGQLGHAAREQKIEWGGDWKTFKDLPHVEHPTKDMKTYEAARQFKAAHGLK